MLPEILYMKVLFVITRADTVGGAQVHVKDLSKFLLAKGHSILVVTGSKGYYNSVLEKNGIPFITCETLHKSIRPIQDCLTLSFLTRIIKQFQPDLVSAHSSKSGILGRLACQTVNTPCIFTVHGWAFTEGVPQPSRAIYQISEKLSEPLANKIVCVSNHDRLLGIKSGMNPNRLLTIHNGMPDIPEEFRANIANASKLVSVVMVARFDKQKDHRTLVEAVRNLPKVKLKLIGDGPTLSSIQRLVEEREMTNRVKFLGYCDNVAEQLANSQIFVLISNWEGFPRTIIEAMRAGLPVVASNVGGVGEAVVDGVTGYCVPCGDGNTLQNRLSHLADNSELRQKMGNAGRQKYESEFTFERMFDKTYKLYEQVVNAPS